MKQLLFLIFLFLIIFSCSKDICSYTRPELRTNKNEYFTGNLNGQPFESLWRPRMEYYTDIKSYGIGFYTNEWECSDKGSYNVASFFYDLNIGDNKIERANASLNILTLPDISSFCCIDSLDPNYENKIVISEIKKDSIIQGTVQLRIIRKKRSQAPNTTDDQNALEFKDCQFSAILKR